MPIFPNVPNVPGVPTLPRDGLAGAALSLLASDVLGLLYGLLGARWGVYLGGARVIQAESVIEVGYKNDYKVADYPIERGGFESYDKVASPYEIRMRFVSGGTELTRAALLQSCELALASLQVFDVVTPERTYSNANVSHMDYRRLNNDGLGLLIVDLTLVEVRLISAQAFTNTASPVGAGTVNGGTVQAGTPTPTQQEIGVQ